MHLISVNAFYHIDYFETVQPLHQFEMANKLIVFTSHSNHHSKSHVTSDDADPEIAQTQDATASGTESSDSGETVRSEDFKPPLQPDPTVSEPIGITETPITSVHEPFVPFIVENQAKIPTATESSNSGETVRNELGKSLQPVVPEPIMSQEVV